MPDWEFLWDKRSFILVCISFWSCCSVFRTHFEISGYNRSTTGLLCLYAEKFRVSQESLPLFYSELRIISAGHRIPQIRHHLPTQWMLRDITHWRKMWDFSSSSTWRDLVWTHLLGFDFCFQAALISSPVIGRTQEKCCLVIGYKMSSSCIISLKPDSVHFSATYLSLIFDASWHGWAIIIRLPIFPFSIFFSCLCSNLVLLSMFQSCSVVHIPNSIF